MSLDLDYPRSMNLEAIALFSLLVGCGSGFGQFTAATLGPRYGWRAPYRVVGGAALLVSAVSRDTSAMPWKSHGVMKSS